MDQSTLAGGLLIGTFVVLMLLKVPVAFSLLFASIASAVANGTGMSALVNNMLRGVDSLSLLSIPFFIIAGEIMGAGGISNRLIDLANLLVGWMPGGLAMVNCIDSMFFGGISGSAVADVSSLGSVVIPMMVKQGYDEDFAVGLTVTSACQGVLIPPSHNMVIFALVAGGGVSIGKLFMGGLVPGVMLGLGLMACCFILTKKRNYPHGVSVPRGERARVLFRAVIPLITIVIIMGGVSTGLCTVTESAAFACVYAFIVTFFVIREIRISAMGRILKNSLKTLAIVMTLLATSKAFAYMMIELRIPEAITAGLLSLSHNRVVLLLLINALLLLLGCVMDMAPLILIMTPILMPVCVGQLGMDPIHFGVMLIFNLAIGLCTPPVGSALFVGCAIGKTPIERTARNMLPLYAVMVVALVLITFVPNFVMLVPNMLTAAK